MILVLNKFKAGGKNQMLEFFETIYCTNSEVKDDELKELYRWIEKNKFPQKSLPYDYISLMHESNGGIYMNGEREYQFLSLKEVTEYYEAYMFSEYMPYAYPFAMDGCGNFYVFNLRTDDECVYAVSAGNMGWESDECYKIAKTFKECLTQKQLLDNYIN